MITDTGPAAAPASLAGVGSPGTPHLGRARRWAVWAVIALLVLLLAIAGASKGPGASLDPNGTGPDGTKGLVLLLREYGATVTVDRGLPGPGVTTALVLRDQLDPARRRALAAWVRAGGRLVVADPSSPLQVGAPTHVGNGLTEADLHPTGPCPALGLDDVERLSVGPSLLLRAAPGQAAITCYPAGAGGGEDAGFVVAANLGAGRVVGVGGAGAWINARLDQEDNAALALDLLAPGAADHVDVLVASPAGSGTKSVLDLLNPRLKSAAIELLVAFAVLAWWRGRRLGRPIPSRDPVTVPGSEIVVAVGDLLARTHNRDAAARQLRDATRRWLGERLGVGPRATPEQVADVAAGRAGWTREAVLALLGDVPLPDEQSLVALARSLAQLREEVARGSAPVR